MRLIQFWLQLPLAVQIGLIGLVGAMIGALANHAIYAFAYFDPRPISPWMKPHGDAPPRRPIDRIPIVGWFGLARESSVHGKRHHWRPMAIEVTTAVALIWYYFYAVRWGSQLPPAARVPEFLDLYQPQGCVMFAVHAVLFGLLIAATFIDFDERTIPDEITVPGTIFGIVAGSLSMFTFVPTAVGGFLLPTSFDSPWMIHSPAINPNSPWFDGRGLIVGLAIVCVFCFALCDRRFTMAMVHRRGWSGASVHFFAILRRSPYTVRAAGLCLVMMVFVAAMHRIGGETWYGCFTSLVGLAVGGGTVWAIRIVASGAMNRVAMGFGDVTLMAMVGTMVGWQATLIAFFLAPFTSIVIVVLRLLLTGDKETPFGPYLAAGTVLTIVFWDAIYNNRFAIQLQMLGGILLYLAIVMLVAMAVMLMVWRLVSSRFGR